MNSDSYYTKSNAVESVSFQHRLKDPKRIEIKQLNEIAVLIRSGGNYGKLIDGIRLAKREGDETTARGLKEQLPAVLFAGKFRYTNNSGLLQHSGLLVVDFDDVPESDLQRHKQELAVHPSTRLVFISPSGAGLKWVVAVNAHDEATHKRCFDLCLEETAKRYPDLDRYVDLKGGDLSRRCFMSHDPEVIERTPTEQIGTVAISRQGCEVEWQNDRNDRNTENGRNTSNRGDELVVVQQDIHPSVGANPALRERVQKLVPSQARQNYDHLFQLGRLCRDLEREMGLAPRTLPLRDQNEVFRLWMELTPAEFLRHSEADYRDEFTQKFYDAKLGLDVAPWREAWERSKTEPPPDWWPSVIQHPENKRLRMLSMLSIQSQLTRKSVIAPLDKIAEVARAEGLSDLAHPQMVGRVLKGLRPVLKLVSKASVSPRRAAVYEFCPPSVGPQASREVEDALCARTERRAPAQLQGVT